MQKTVCPYCGVGCGLLYKDGKIFGDKMHISTHGDLCKKPLYLPHAINQDRVLNALYRDDKNLDFQINSTDDAIEIIANKLKSLTSDECYFYISGQLGTEDSYVINKFVKGALATNNIDANSRLCMASAVVAHKMAFGSDGALASYSDIDDSDTLIFIGSNAAITHPVLFKRALRAQKKGAKIVVIDPVKTQSAQKANYYIQINCGSDTLLLNGVLYLLYHKRHIDNDFISKHTTGFEDVILAIKDISLDEVYKQCGILPKELELLATLFASSNKLLSLWCQGLNQSSNAVAKNLALINLHLASGRIGAKGYPFSLTGQPNAMGGREVGYLTNGLPGYRDVRVVADREFCETFWGYPQMSIAKIPGKTITQAIDDILDNKIKLLWIVCTNPAVTLPNLSKVYKALSKQDCFVIVQDAYYTDTCNFANIVLPATQWGEKDTSMTNSERVISQSEILFKKPDNAKHDFEIFCNVAKKLGFSGFDFNTSKQIHYEFMQICKDRSCDFSGFEEQNNTYQWGGTKLYQDGLFAHENQKAKFCVAKYEPPKETINNHFSFILTTGRTKNQWHTMTRTEHSSELLLNEERHFVLINGEDAQRLNIQDGDNVRVFNQRGEVKTTARIGDIKYSHLFMPFGYPKKYGDIVNVLMSDDCDPLSFEPELKLAAVDIAKENI